MTYQLRDHTADIAVEATATSIDAVFADVASGLTAAMCDNPPDGGDRFTVTVSAESKEAVLFDYLDQLIYERDVRGVLPVNHDCTVTHRGAETEAKTETADGASIDTPAGADSDTTPAGADSDTWTVTASARGVPLQEVHARDVKAVTYSEMELDRRGDTWYAYVVFDV